MAGKLATCFVLCALLQACTFVPDVHLVATVDSTDPAVVEETARVLSARFAKFRASLFATTDVEVSGSTLRYTFKNGAPDTTVLEYLCRTRGRVRAFVSAEPAAEPWFTDRDIQNAALSYEKGTRVFNIRLTAEAGARLLRLTSEHLGQNLTMEMDGQTLMDARINGVFGPRFQVTAPELPGDLTMATTIILANGGLPANVTAVAFEAE